jgi:hypothetical protein
LLTMALSFKQFSLVRQMCKPYAIVSKMQWNQHLTQHIKHCGNISGTTKKQEAYHLEQDQSRILGRCTVRIWTAVPAFSVLVDSFQSMRCVDLQKKDVQEVLAG